MWAWLAAALGAWLLACLFGAETTAAAKMAALTFAPAVGGFILLPRLREPSVAVAFIAIWAISAIGMAASTGGAHSPLAAAFVLPPAFAMALGRTWASEAGAGAVLAYAGAAGMAVLWDEPVILLGPYPEILAVVVLALAAGLMAIAPTRAAVGANQRVAEVSHELRTPLTHILGFSEMIERQMFGAIEARYVEYAGLIRKSGGHLLALVNDLLDLSKIEAGRYEIELEDFDARAIIDEVVRLSVDAAAKKQITLGVVTPETPLQVRADSGALRRVLINTIGNAIKFTPEGGRVMVIARTEEIDLVIETLDNGPGIPEHERSTLGRAYARGSTRAEGTGLGLSLVRALAELHGGRLSLHDAPDGGALVRVTMPVLAP